MVNTQTPETRDGWEMGNNYKEYQMDVDFSPLDSLGLSYPVQVCL